MPRLARSIVPLAAVIALTWAASAAEAQHRVMTSARQVWDRRPLDVLIRYGAGDLSVEPADPPMLYELRVEYEEGQLTPVATYDSAAARVTLAARGPDRGNRRRSWGESKAAIKLTREVPIDLDLEFGAGQAEIELGGIQLEAVSISTGASDASVSFDEPNPIVADRLAIQAGAADLRVTRIGNLRASQVTFRGGVGATLLDFGGTWDRNARVTIEMGIGSVTLRLPRSLGVQVDRSSLLASFDADGLERRGDSYYNAAWGNAPHQLTIDVTAGLGSIEIDWID